MEAVVVVISVAIVIGLILILRHELTKPKSTGSSSTKKPNKPDKY